MEVGSCRGVYEDVRVLFGLWWIRVLLLGVLAFSGCALNDRKDEAITQNAASNQGGSTQDAAPVGYPYPAEGLWRRLVQVIKTPPDDLTYRKFGEIFGFELDEDKTHWYGDKSTGKYFLVSKKAIGNTGVFPFKWISLSQGAPDEKTRTRRMAFDFELIDFALNRQALFDLSEKYCVRPKRSEIEALGYQYDGIGTRMPPPTDINGNRYWTPYRDEIYVDDVNNRFRSKKTITLKVLPTGCLIGVTYFNRPEF